MTGHERFPEIMQTHKLEELIKTLRQNNDPLTMFPNWAITIGQYNESLTSVSQRAGTLAGTLAGATKPPEHLKGGVVIHVHEARTALEWIQETTNSINSTLKFLMSDWIFQDDQVHEAIIVVRRQAINEVIPRFLTYATHMQKRSVEECDEQERVCIEKSEEFHSKAAEHDKQEEECEKVEKKLLHAKNPSANHSGGYATLVNPCEEVEHLTYQSLFLCMSSEVGNLLELAKGFTQYVEHWKNYCKKTKEDDRKNYPLAHIWNDKSS